MPDLDPSRWRSLTVELRDADFSFLLHHPSRYTHLRNVSLQGADDDWTLPSLYYLPALVYLRLKVTVADGEGVIPSSTHSSLMNPTLRHLAIENFDYRTTLIAMIDASDVVETLVISNAVDRQHHTAGIPTTFERLHSLTLQEPLHHPGTDQSYQSNVVRYLWMWRFPSLKKLCVDYCRQHGPNPTTSEIGDNPLLHRPEIANQLTYLRLCHHSGPLTANITLISQMASLAHLALYNPETAQLKVEAVDDVLGEALDIVSDTLEKHSGPASFPSLTRFDYFTPNIRAAAVFPPYFRFILAVWRKSTHTEFFCRFPRSVGDFIQHVLDESGGLVVVCDLENVSDLY